MSDPSDDSAFDLAPADVPRATPVVATADDASKRLTDLRERVYATMRKRHTVDTQMAWTLVLGGSTVLLSVGFAFAFFMMIVSLLLFGDAAPRFNLWLLLYLLAMIPLLLWQAHRTRGGFFTFAETDVDLTHDPDNLGEFVLKRSKANLDAIVHGFVWAPRALLAGVRALRGVPEPGLDLVLPEAADLLTLMLSLDGGVKIKALAPPGQDPMQLMPTLKWLDTHDYIGISTRGDRVWVSSFAKKRLAADHGEVFNFKATPKPSR